MEARGFDEWCDDAAGHLKTGDPVRSANQLRFAAMLPGVDADTPKLVRIAELVASIAEAMQVEVLVEPAMTVMAEAGKVGGTPGRGWSTRLARAFGRSAPPAATTPSPSTLVRLGHALVDVQLYQVAVPFLRRAYADEPGMPNVVSLLVTALERSEFYEQARDVLLERPQDLQHFWPRYLLCYNALSAGDVETVMTWFAGLEPAGEQTLAAYERMRGMVERLKELGGTCALDDLRGWHYIMNGSVLLHLSPYGFAEGMRGRYAFTQDSNGQIRRELDRMVAVLRATGTPEAIVSAGDRSSEAVALALGELAGLPVRALADGVGGLVVAYDLDHVEPSVLKRLHATRPPLFVRSVNWVQPPPLVPRYVGMLHQVQTAPWAEGLRIGADGKAAVTPASSDSPAELARAIVEATPEADVVYADEGVEDTLESVIAVARAGGAPCDIWSNGPVRSSHFL